jgi:hypothetical protein
LFVVLGVVATAVPVWGTVCLGAGFGVLHMLSGIVIAKRHGG